MIRSSISRYKRPWRTPRRWHAAVLASAVLGMALGGCRGAGAEPTAAASVPTLTPIRSAQAVAPPAAPSSTPTLPATPLVASPVPTAVPPSATPLPPAETVVAELSVETAVAEVSGEQTAVARAREGACALVAGEPATSSEATTDDEAGDVKFDSKTNTITVEEGSSMTLATISRALDRPEALRELAPGEWLLAANLRLEEDAEVRIAAPQVRWLKLRSDAGGFVSIKAFGAKLEFEETCVSSWDAAAGGYDQDYTDGRAFVLARDGARMDIRATEMTYLGYDANESYGVALRLKGTRGEIVDSHLAYNYYGIYSYEASDLIIRGTEVHHSVMYGIDPHTRSNRLLIENNVSHHNGKHGIILAEKCTDSVIRGNVSYSNAMHGIVLYQGSNDNVVEGNTAYGNGYQGINLNNSSDNTIRDNVVYDNVEAGIGVGQSAKRNVVSGNSVRANQLDGIVLFSDATRNEVTDNTVTNNGRFGINVKSSGNVIATDNQLSGNREGDIQTGGE